MSCSLDSNCELTLVESAGACHTSGQDLSSLGDALLQLCQVLIIDSLDPVSAEHTYLLAGLLGRTGISFLLHDYSSYHIKLMVHDSERNVAVAEYLLEISEVAVRHIIIQRCALSGRCLLGRSLEAVIVIVAVVVIAAVAGIAAVSAGF